jgi:hypothetical protein
MSAKSAAIRPGLDKPDLACRQRRKAPQALRCPAAHVADDYWQIGYSELNSRLCIMIICGRSPP